MKMHQQGGVANGGVRLNAGVDVSKHHLDACVGSEARRSGNDAAGWDELIAMLQAANVDLVVVEATGGYERGLVCALQGAGMVVARVKPRQAWDFAKSMGVLTKTDQVDARTLRKFADVLAPSSGRFQRTARAHSCRSYRTSNSAAEQLTSREVTNDSTVRLRTGINHGQRASNHAWHLSLHELQAPHGQRLWYLDLL
jgi:transposase